MFDGKDLTEGRRGRGSDASCGGRAANVVMGGEHWIVRRLYRAGKDLPRTMAVGAHRTSLADKAHALMGRHKRLYGRVAARERSFNVGLKIVL